MTRRSVAGVGPRAIDKRQETPLSTTSSEDFPNLPSVWLHELTWEEVASYLRRRDTIIVPFGTTEQHGPAGSLARHRIGNRHLDKRVILRQTCASCSSIAKESELADVKVVFPCHVLSDSAQLVNDGVSVFHRGLPKNGATPTDWGLQAPVWRPCKLSETRSKYTDDDCAQST